MRMEEINSEASVVEIPAENDPKNGGTITSAGDTNKTDAKIEVKREETTSDRKRPVMPVIQRTRYRKKVLDTRSLDLDYKNHETLERFLSRSGKILPRRMTGASAKVQRSIAREIKRSRAVNLLPITKRI